MSVGEGTRLLEPERRERRRQKDLSKAERERLAKAQAKVDRSLEAAVDYWIAWAATVRELGVSASARSLGMTVPGLFRKLERIDRMARERDGRT